MTPCARHVTGWGAALLFVLLGLPQPARGAWMLPPAPDRAKDFCLVKKDGWYHCFYIRKDTSVPGDSTERDLGHAISRDFYLWTQLPPVLNVRPSNWDNARIWAPDIRKIDGVYYMLYTGVTDTWGEYAFHQRMGLATSTDLMTWNRLDLPVCDCSKIRWTYCDPLQYTGGEFRDPFFMPDPQGPGWIMYYTARPASAPTSYVAGTARSSGDLTEWVNGEPLWITHVSMTGSPKVESPHVFEHNGLYYLTYTGSTELGLLFSTGPDPVGPASSWTYRGSISDMLGVNTQEWFASEYFRDGTHEYFAFVNYDRVDIREIAWSNDWKFTLFQPALFHVQTLTWSKSEVVPGDLVLFNIEAINTVGAHVQIEAFAVNGDGSWTPVPLDEIGLPSTIPMAGLHTTVPWVARTWPNPQDPEASLELVVRLKDLTAEAAPIRVVPNPWGPPQWTGRDGSRRTPRPFPEQSSAGAAVEFRALARAPVGKAALLVDLQEPAPARIELFDVGGRRVRALVDRTLDAGAHVIPWDGRDDAGVMAGRGVYFARLSAAGLQRTVRLLHTP